MQSVAAKFDIVTVRSPGTDRRALSQAWYSALHLARADRSRAVAQRGNIPLLNTRLFRRGKVCSPTFPSRHPWLREKLERPSRNVTTTELPTEKLLGDRRARLSPLASDIVARLRSQPKATRFVFDVPQGRVCLYVVRGESRVQIAAFCSPALRDVVEKAMLQVRYAL